MFVIKSNGKKDSGIFFEADNIVQYWQNYRQSELIIVWVPKKELDKNFYFCGEINLSL